ncbi:MAG: hypothetical protein ACKO1L_00115 [Brachymonas sp.]
MPANSQNLPDSAPSSTTAGLQEHAERHRIANERAALQNAYQAQQQTCYQKLAVTPCLTQARDEHNDKMRDLKRQEVALDDAQRKRKAAERMRMIDDRNSPEAQLQQAERRGRAMEQAKQRETHRMEKQQERDAKQASAHSSAQAKSEDGARPTAPSPRGKPKKEAPVKLPPEQRPDQAAKSAQSQQAAAQRERAAKERRDKAEQREAQRKKPISPGLPVPL